MTLFHESYREQSRRLLMLSNLSHSTLVSYNDRCTASSRMNEQTRAHICIAFIVLTFSRATIGRICKIPACYWSNYFGCFRQYKNPGQDVSRINGTYGHPTSGMGGCVVCLRNRLASRTRRLIHSSLFTQRRVCVAFLNPGERELWVSWQKKGWSHKAQSPKTLSRSGSI